MEVGLKNINRHQCGYIDYPSCHKYVDAQTHRCVIQRALTPQEIREQKKEQKRKRRHQGLPAKRGAAACLQDLRANEEEGEEVDEEKLPPLHVFFDIEAVQPQEHHVANLVVAETEDDPRPFRFRGEHSLRDFLEWLDTLTLNDTHQVNIIAHNFQGYDGYFVIHQYHSNNQIVEQLHNGCKLLEVKHDSIRFIKSFSFFQMPLSAFPKTFAIAEAISPEAHQEFENWHREQRDNHVVFDFQKVLLAYCESVVRLLKEGCLTFKRLFEAKAGFNPFEHITIASACNCDLHMNRIIPNGIASEPMRGWHNRINQSQVALKWLTWRDHQLRQQALEQLTCKDLEAHDLMA